MSGNAPQPMLNKLALEKEKKYQYIQKIINYAPVNYTHANKKKATQLTSSVENKYKHEHVMITKLYIVSHILYDRHLYEYIL